MTSRVPVWIFVVMFWALLTVVYSTQIALIPRPASEQGTLWITLTWQALYYLTWAPVTLIVWRVTRGWDLETLDVRRFLLRHAALAVVVCAGQGVFVALVAMAITGRQTTDFVTGILWSYLRVRIHTQLLIYAAIVATGQALLFSNRYRERQLAAVRLEAQLAEARLDTLRAQLQPHFLFNSLHTIASLARVGDTAAVVRLISGFSELLRHLLDTQHTHHPLRDELALVDRYLDIQHVRFGDRLRVRIDVSQDAAAARVPLLVLQPLVENALRHGLAPRIEGGSLDIRAERDGEHLRIRVIDDGVGLPEGWIPGNGSGTGLRNLSSRLAAEFGDVQALRVSGAHGTGVTAEVRLPYAPA